MNNLYRDLAPITDEAWGEIEDGGDPNLQAAHRRTPGRRRQRAGRPGDGGGQHRVICSTSPRRATAWSRTCARASRWCGCGCRSPSSRNDIDDVERGSQDSDWDPVKEAAKKLAFAEDRAIFEGYEAASHRRHPQVQLQPGRWRCPAIRGRSPT